MHKSRFYPLLPPILHNPVLCRADGLLGDAHDAALVLVVHAHLVEDEEENLSLAVKSQKDFISLHPQIYWTMEQRFSNNSLDLETLREFCKREGEAVIYHKGDQLEREGDPARWFAYVESGCFKYVNHGISDDREHITWFSFEGEFVVDYPTYLYGPGTDFHRGDDAQPCIQSYRRTDEAVLRPEQGDDGATCRHR